MKFCEEVECVPGSNFLDFGGDPVSFVDPASFSMIFTINRLGVN